MLSCSSNKLNQRLCVAVAVAVCCVVSLASCDRSSVSRKYHLDSLVVLVATAEQRFGSSDNPDSGS